MKALARLPLPLAAPFLASALLLSTAFAQGPITLVGEGPGQAAPGDTGVYSVRYEIAGEPTAPGPALRPTAVYEPGTEPTVVAPTPQPTPTPRPITPTPTPLPTESDGSDTDPLMVVAVALGPVAGGGPP